MTKREVEAYNAGVVAMSEVAVRIADELDKQPWKPGREGAANALRGLADEGLALLKPISASAVQATDKAA